MNQLSQLQKLTIAVISLLMIVLPAHAQDAVLTPIVRYEGIHHPVLSRAGMVVTQNAIASQVGADILARGGNAVDAAVAIGFTLAVTRPRAGNLGGGGFMLVHLAGEGKTIAIDYREMAPAAATRDMFLDAADDVDNTKARFSHLSAGVPGTVAGMHYALTHYGTMSWAEIIQPAIELAESGFPISYDLSGRLDAYSKWLTRNDALRAVFYLADLTPRPAGELLLQPDLAWTLKQISAYGPDAFYRGAIADKIVAEMETGYGLITKADLAAYKVTEREPVRGTYRGHEVIAMPPPSSGGIHIIQMLNILETYDLAALGQNSAASLHLMTEAMRRAFADRSQHLGDPDHYTVPVDWLISKEYGQALASEIDPTHATPSSDVSPGAPAPYESPDTTHFSVIDRDGNAVANTYTINFSFGSGIMVSGAGFLLNNEMDDFSAKPGTANAFGLLGGEANAIEPTKRPLSSMTPTLVLKDGQPILVTGSPGGSRIITAVLQAIVNAVDFNLNVAEGVHRPRIHHQWYPDTLLVEPGMSVDTVGVLKALGHEIAQTSRTSGSVQSVGSSGPGSFYGAADPRSPDGLAIGVDVIEASAFMAE